MILRALDISNCYAHAGVFLHVYLDITQDNSSSHILLNIGSGPDQFIALQLLEGFQEHTQGRGMVVSSWTPLLNVLQHEFVGGFVTHCRWNSELEELEAVCTGVPMVGWPLYEEQRPNRVVLVAEEVDKKVRMLMEGEEGVAVRSKMRSMKDAAAVAVGKCGSSWVALDQLVESLKR